MDSKHGKTAEGVALGACIKSARARTGFRQEELAAKAGVGTSTLRQIEAGSATGTSIFTIFRILDAANASLEDLHPVFESSRTGQRSP